MPGDSWFEEYLKLTDQWTDDGAGGIIQENDPADTGAAQGVRDRYGLKPPSKDELQRRVDAGRDDPYNQGAIAERIISGEYSLRYKHNEYIQHTKGTALYEQVTKDREKQQSYLTISEIEAQRLVYLYAGTGKGRINKYGEIAGVKYVTMPIEIGECFNFQKGGWRKTARAQIIYAKSGVHIVPVSDEYQAE